MLTRLAETTLLPIVCVCIAAIVGMVQMVGPVIGHWPTGSQGYEYKLVVKDSSFNWQRSDHGR